MIIIDAFFRFSGIGLLLMLTVMTLYHHRKWKSAPYLIFSCITLIGFLVGFAPITLRPTGILYVIARLADIPSLIFIWLFTLSLFQKDFTLKPSYLLLGIFYSVSLLWVRLTEFGWTQAHPDWYIMSLSVLALAITGHLCLSTLMGRTDDLLKKRRASRVYFVIVIASVITISELSEYFFLPTKWMFTIKAIIIWPAIVWGFLWMTSFNTKALTFADDKRDVTPLSERDKKLRDKLIYEMTNERAYKEPSLTIITLASKLAVNQHRLRSLINQVLGHKNFSEFVNGYRIAAVKEALSNPKNENTQILTLALDSGFKSLSSFNRAFKESENITPTEYRNSCREAKI